MEHRILLGTVAFLAILVLVGWIAINEGGRMAAFDRQFAARSVERGAALFISNCSECHGTDGRGVAGRAPALNSPLLFGHDFLAETRRERETLQAELEAEGTTEERTAEINTRLAELDTEEAALRSQMQPAIDNGYDPDSFNRLVNLGWSSSLHNFVYTTLVSGRPTSSSYWPQPMAAWSQTANGPLRDDQLEDLTAFILNWDKGDNWTIEDLNAINQFPKVPVEGGTQVLEDAVGEDTPTADIMVGLEGLTGDPQNGSEIYNSSLGCAGCHLNAAVAPPMEGTFTRTQEERLQAPELAGYTVEQYLAESIIHPNVYIAPGYPAGIMPQNFGARLGYQDLADLIAFLETQDQPID